MPPPPADFIEPQQNGERLFTEELMSLQSDALILPAYVNPSYRGQRRTIRRFPMRAKRIATKSRLVSLALTALLPLGGFASQAGAEFLPTGKQITPTAATGSTFGPLNPDLPGHPDFTAGQAVTTATSPDGKTLLILTSGYNS